MRGDTALTVRLLRRGSGIAGVTIVLGGALVVSGTFSPWRATVAQVDVLGVTDDRVIAVTHGVPATVGGWVLAVLGIAVLVLGVAVALDRPPPRSRRAVLLLAGGCALATVAVLLLGPGGAAPDHAQLLAQLGAEGGKLPGDVEVTGHQRHSIGPWLTLAGTVVAFIGGAAAPEA